ncbi:MAG: DUF2269 domain-containing protein [Proteobacteria bacterium]|nr:DUF2269 domain-containing protein [Pseudomonadota bacterium]
MIDAYLWVKTLHIVSSTILFGTGLGTAFHMWLTHLGGDVRAIAAVSRNVVLADFLFTTPAIILQPVTGVLLIWIGGHDSLAPWLVAAYALYILAGLCWLPVVRLQIRVRDIARAAAEKGQPLPPLYGRYMKIWFALGWPAFAAVIAIFWLMTEKPQLW